MEVSTRRRITSALDGEVKESKWEGLAQPAEEDKEYSPGGDEEESQEIHVEPNAEDAGDSSITEDCTETPQLVDTLHLTDTLHPAETTRLTYVVVVLTFRLVKCSTTLW